ncbi:hypothetical protein BC827DRAFT_615491 [Russula dissimulans]|nr:hypothetical protein BC827DRAFT_615491 [Russula dissimulans]
MSVTPTNDLSEVKLEDDEPNIARPKRATSAHLQPNRRDSNTREYTIVNSLRTPRSTSHAVAALYDQIMDRSINLDPDDQRDAVWSNEKRIGLIDSVFRNYYIPPIIFAFSTTDDGSEIRNCIDGKQRLRSIQMFMNGEIPHRDHLTAECHWYKKSELHAGPLLSKRLQRYFQYKLIQCVEYDNLNEEQEREIFQRVEHGLALTPAESLQGLSGPWPDFLREIKSKVIGDRRFGDSFDWGRTPWRDFNMLASIVYLVENFLHGNCRPHTKPWKPG